MDAESCRKVGILAFGRFLKNSPLRLLANRVYLRSCETPAEVIKHADKAETIHFWAFIIGMPYLVFCILYGWWLAALMAVTIQTIGNLYPYYHLRHTKSRLMKMIEKTNRRNSNQTCEATAYGLRLR